jgi:hypothetical protein
LEVRVNMRAGLEALMVVEYLAVVVAAVSEAQPCCTSS